MSILGKTRRAIREMVFGDTLLPHGVSLGFVDPQTEIAVRLEGCGEPLDVTERHTVACSDPLTICVALDRPFQRREMRHLTLRFLQREGRRQTLGEIRLKPAGNFSAGGSELAGFELAFFEARSARNYCLPRAQIWAHDVLRTCRNWRRTDASALRMTLGGMRAMTVLFIRPYPVVLVSHRHAGGNIFPMNLMGDLGNGQFGFALVDSREAALGVERAGRIALSSVPLAQAAFAFALAPNHFRRSIDWNRFPFATRTSATFEIPVPAFAPRVREIEIAGARTLGSHRFFWGRVIADERSATCESLHIVDGLYQSWRLKGRRADLDASLAADALNKRGSFARPRA